MGNVDLDNKIRLTRGDTFLTTLFLNQGTDFEPMRYVLEQDDKVYLGIMEPNQPFEYALIKKVYTKDNLTEDGDVLIRLEPEDTECLMPGKYFYQIKLAFTQKGKLQINTVVDKTQFEIQE